MAASKKKPRQTAPQNAAFEPSVRRFVDWTTDLCKAAERSADSGYLRSAARLCEWILTDDRVSAALNTRVQSLLGLEPAFEASGDKRRSNRTVKHLDAGEDWWAGYPEPETALILKWGLVLGVGPAQHQWPQDPDHGDRWLPHPEFWHPQHVRYDTESREWKTWVSAQGSSSQNQEVVVTPGDGQWVFHCPFGKNRPWAWGLWHGLWPLVLLKQLARQDWSRASEKAAILALTHDRQAADQALEQSQQQRQQLASDIYNRGRNTVAALPPGVDLKLVQTVADTEELYNAQIEMANTAIAILIRGGNLGTETKGGSLAAIESQERTGDLTNLRFDAAAWTTTAHDQSLVWWAEYNYGDARLAPWPVYPVEPDEDLVSKTASDEKAFANADTAERLGFEVDRQEFLEQHKITWCKPGERPPEPEPPKPDDENGTDQNPDGTGDELAEVAEEDDSGGGDAGDGPSGADAPPGQGRNGDAQPQGRSAALASRAATKGHANGQDYVDRSVKALQRHGARELAPTVAAMLAEVAKAGSYEEARTAIAERYAKLAAPTKLAELTDAAITLGQLAGHLSVDEEP